MRHSTDSNPPTPASLPAAVPTAARRAAIAAAVEAHNQANPDARLPRSAAGLLSRQHNGTKAAPITYRLLLP